MVEAPALRRFYSQVSERFDIDSWSGRYFGLAAILALVRIIWVICQTSKVFGSPPDRWVVEFENTLGWLLVAYVVIGLVLHAAVIYLRQSAETNEPLSALVTNAAGAVFFAALTERVSTVVIANEPSFGQWAGLLRTGLTLGGIYALVALGYTLVYGILFMINFAHGEVMMLGAYGGWFGLMFLTSNGENSFEAGATTIAFIVVPLLVAIMFLPLESLVSRLQTSRDPANIADPNWTFTLLSIPVRALIGGVVGYGALRALGQNAPNLYLLVITIVGMVFVAVVGMFTSVSVAVTLERIAYRPLRKAPRLTPLITAIGASIFLQQMALRMFSGNPRNYNVGQPKLLSDPAAFNLNFGRLGLVPIAKDGVVIVFASLILMALLFFIVRRTKLGRGMRAVAEDKDTAALMGTNVDRIIVMTFILGAALAGAAGVMLGFRGDNINFRFGFTYGLKAFTAAVLGGIGNIPGAMLGGFFLGLVESLGPTALGLGNEWKDVIAFSILVLVIIYRPTGLLGEIGAEKKV